MSKSFMRLNDFIVGYHFWKIFLIYVYSHIIKCEMPFMKMIEKHILHILNRR